jgi:hypothetical protein
MFPQDDNMYQHNSESNPLFQRPSSFFCQVELTSIETVQKKELPKVDSHTEMLLLQNPYHTAYQNNLIQSLVHLEYYLIINLRNPYFLVAKSLVIS